MQFHSNGGPAFPLETVIEGPARDPILNEEVPEGKRHVHTFYGMTLRDYFAAQALCGIAGHVTGPKERGGESAAQAHARWAYNVADAMLAERAK